MRVVGRPVTSGYLGFRVGRAGRRFRVCACGTRPSRPARPAREFAARFDRGDGDDADTTRARATGADRARARDARVEFRFARPRRRSIGLDWIRSIDARDGADLDRRDHRARWCGEDERASRGRRWARRARWWRWR